jgi:hypothetical protein
MKVWSLDFPLQVYCFLHGFIPVPDLGKDVAIPGQDRTFPVK